MDATDTDVLATNAAFYAAINQRNQPHMDALWAREAPVACIHPGWDALEGREEVMRSWKAILSNPRAPHIELSNASPYVYEHTAFVVCVETIDGDSLAATNVFVREGDGWKLVHHHAGPMATRREPSPPPPISELN